MTNIFPLIIIVETMFRKCLLYRPKQPKVGADGILDNMLDSWFIVNEFEFQLHCYVHFPTNTTMKGMNSLPPGYKLIIFTNPSARAGYDTRSIFKRSLTGLNSEFSFS